MNTLREFKDLLETAFISGVSDIILAKNEPPLFKRTNSNLGETLFDHIKESDLASLAKYLLKTDTNDLENINFRSVSHEEPGFGRIRATICKEKDYLRIFLRLIPYQIKSFQELNLPDRLVDLLSVKSGLILVTGATGNGKSTTISAMIEHINRTRHGHIVTIEDPIEYVYKREKSLITQREVGLHVDNYRTGVVDALRLAPDVIFCGEIRDKETFEAVLEAAETDHLVISAIHTKDAEKTISRLLGYYPAADRDSIRERIAHNLNSIISLRLLPTNKADLGVALLPAVELLTVTPGIRECLSQHDKLKDIRVRMEQEARSSRESWTFDQYLLTMMRNGYIDSETLYQFASKKGDIESELIKSGLQRI